MNVNYLTLVQPISDGPCAGPTDRWAALVFLTFVQLFVQPAVVALLTAISVTRPKHPISRASHGGPVHPPARIGA
jgi:hypothetical protein